MLISQVPVNRGCWVTFSANIQPTDHTSTGVEYFKPSTSSDHQTKHEFDTQLQSISPSIFLIPYSSFLILIITVAGWDGGREGTSWFWLSWHKWQLPFGISQIWQLPYSTIGVSSFNRTAIL
ncbi:hypothetical protein CsSME_00019806 [Camellia sinensis var. sinensis]